MNEFYEINKGRYYIERVFNNDCSILDIIEKQIKAKKGNYNLLTNEYDVYYNSNGGSIADKEVLQ